MTEYYSRSAIILENVHNQDLGGKRVKSISAARLETAASIDTESAEIRKPEEPLHLMQLQALKGPSRSIAEFHEC